MRRRLPVILVLFALLLAACHGTTPGSAVARWDSAVWDQGRWE